MSTTVSWLTCRTRTPLYSQGLYSSFCCSMRRSRQKLVRSFMALGGIASLWFSFACHKQSPPSYVDEDAYNVYSSILPHSSPLVVREATTAYDLCEVPLDEQAEKILRPALDNFTRVNSEPWLLRQSLDYGLLSEQEIRTIFGSDMSQLRSGNAWQTFYRHHPSYQGWIEVSAVGFNSDKTVAVVYIGYQCGEECAGGEFKALEKKNGTWQLLTGHGRWNHCAWVHHGISL
jgi:hypothetical protein